MKILNRDLSIIDFIPPLFVRPLKRLKARVLNQKEETPLKPFISPLLKSYSQFNEDLLIDLLFELKNNGFYLDIGANDPIFNNNMKRFYERGWRGINIEPGIDNLKKFSEVRIHDINLNIGVGPSKGTLTFYEVIGDSTLSSFSPIIAKKMATKFDLKIREIPIEVLRLVDVFEKYVREKHVDFMSVDAEGLDFEILQSNDWKRFRPSLIMVEIDNQNNQIVKFMNLCNYVLVFNNYHNGIFIDRTTSEKALANILNPINGIPFEN
jgi:FkbM family methyltransferase